MFGLYDIFAGGEVLCKHFAIVLILLTLLREIMIVHSNYLRLLLVVDLIQLYLFEHELSVVILSLETRDKSVAVRLDD